MSIPDRLWRVVKGYWTLAEDRVRDAEAQASAYGELADALRRSEPFPPAGTPARSGAPATAPAASSGLPDGHDPLQASYELMGLRPGTGLTEVEKAFEERLRAIRPEDHPAGSAERAALEAKRSALHAAYDRLRDALNTTETRFERLEL